MIMRSVIEFGISYTVTSNNFKKESKTGTYLETQTSHEGLKLLNTPDVNKAYNSRLRHVTSAIDFFFTFYKS